MCKSKKPFKNYIKDFKVENYFENTYGEIQNNSLIVKTDLNDDDLSKINSSNTNIKNNCVIIIKKDKESMNKITLNDLYNLIKENDEKTNKKMDEGFKSINNRLENVESFIEEQKVFNKKQELFNEKVNNFINKQEEFNNKQEVFNKKQEVFNEKVQTFMDKQEEFNNKQESFNKEVIKKLDTHEKALKKAKLL